MKYFLLIVSIFFITTSQAQLSATYLRCESLVNPIGVESKQPALSWQLLSDQKNIMQVAYRLLVSDDSTALLSNKANIWDSKKVNSSASIQVKYAGKPLVAAKKYYWKLMSWDNKGNASTWSDIASFQMGLLQKSDWKNAQWIAYANLPDSSKIIPAEHGNGKKEWGKRPDVLPMFRKTFKVSKSIQQATIFISGLGHFELTINGRKIGDHFMDPGWTKYSKQAQYVGFDITENLKPIKNAIGVMLGNGFYYMPGERYRKMTGAYGYPKMIARIVIRYVDGTEENIVTDRSWKVTESPITFSSIYGGEDYDAKLEQKDWNRYAFDDKDWPRAVIAEPHNLIAQMAPPVKSMQAFEPVKENRLTFHRRVYDMGQNMSGIPMIQVFGRGRDTIRITCGELLKPDGTVNQRATGSPSYYTYILKGGLPTETWMPRFSYSGFRYIQVDHIRVDTTDEDSPFRLQVMAYHTRNSTPTTGSFQSSSKLFNDIFSLIKWSINSNMQSVLTDCPHRERLGWQEQVHLMGDALQYNYDMHAIGKKIMTDIRAEQNSNGLVPSTIPEFTEMHFANGWFRDSPEWGSNAILLPWNLYKWYGDKDELQKNYLTMQRYMEYLRSKDSSYLLMYGLGDWYDLGPNRPGFSQLTPMGITATAYYYHDLIIMSKIATILGKQKDIVYYTNWAKTVKEYFNKAFYNASTIQYGSGSQTSNAMAVSFDLVDEKNKANIVERIIDDIKQRNYGLTSGDIGFRHLLKVLEEAGRHDIIYAMNNRSDVPGYGYQLAQGATALTESWQALPTVSNNHFMLGHLMEWFYTSVGGIRAAEDAIAFNKVIIEPKPVGDIRSANVSFNSPYGKIISKWKIEDQKMMIEISVPVNATAVVNLPANNEYTNPIKVGSGNYSYTITLK